MDEANISSTISQFSICCNNSTEIPVSLPNDSIVYQRLCSNLQTLINPCTNNDIFSDVIVCVSGRSLPLHRSILAARSPFFMSFFSSKGFIELASSTPISNSNVESTRPKLDLACILNTFSHQDSIGNVGFDAFFAIVGFLYCGKQSIPEVKCIDEQCLHEACGPKVKFSIEMLHLSSVFDVPELKDYWQHYLQNMVWKAEIDEVVSVLLAARLHEVAPLFSLTKQMIATSNMGIIDLQKQLPSELADDILASRSKPQPEAINPTKDKECQRIRKALDSDDIELVHLLLKEGRATLDEAYALHYATAYCDPRTVKDVLEIGLADINLRNDRGFTVLHVAAMRRDPFILVALLSKGANPFGTTPDGRTALQLCSRLTRRYDDESNMADAELQKECLPVEILHQAGMKNLFEDEAFPPAENEKDLYNRLLYLENRVAVARLLFPQEVKLVTGISHLESTSEFTGSVVSHADMLKEGKVDLNKTPANIPVMNESLLKRVEALRRTVVIGRKMFPRVTAMLNNFVEDESLEIGMEITMESGEEQTTMESEEEQTTRKRRYHELKEVLEEAFRKDVAAMERNKTSRKKLS